MLCKQLWAAFPLDRLSTIFSSGNAVGTEPARRRKKQPSTYCLKRVQTSMNWPIAQHILFTWRQRIVLKVLFNRSSIKVQFLMNLPLKMKLHLEPPLTGSLDQLPIWHYSLKPEQLFRQVSLVGNRSSIQPLRSLGVDIYRPDSGQRGSFLKSSSENDVLEHGPGAVVTILLPHLPMEMADNEQYGLLLVQATWNSYSSYWGFCRCQPPPTQIQYCSAGRCPWSAC